MDVHSPFPAVSPLVWRAQVEKDLADASFEDTFTYPVAPGVVGEPLYTDLPAGQSVDASRGQNAPWAICQDLRGAALPSPKTVTDVLTQGASGMVLSAQAAATKSDELKGILAAVQNTADNVVLIFQDQAPLSENNTHTLLQTLARKNLCAHLFAAHVGESTATAIQSALENPNVRPLGVMAKGEDAVAELSSALSQGIAHLRSLETQGITAAKTFAGLSFGLPMHGHFLTDLAKVRALRTLLHMLAEHYGADKNTIHIHCAEGPSAKTPLQSDDAERNAWLDVLRATGKAMAATIGGCDSLSLTPHAIGKNEDAGARLSRNTQLLLQRESHLAQVQDAAAGAYAIEHLTQALCKKSWEAFLSQDKGAEA